ncbi:hypothetical protein EV361DRAFT_465760 [Lentinula raphanica]|nr:hypothetical protein EV361DRAFT_465760 [Lentinula raphanica]
MTYAYEIVETALLQLTVLGMIWFFSSLPGIANHVYSILSISSDRPWTVAQSCSRLHPYIMISCSSVIFLGPISFVLPLLILQDTFFHAWFMMVHLLHDYVPVWPFARYYYTTNSSMEFVSGLGRIFAWLEWIAAIYNTWTTRHKSLLVLRVLAAATAVYVALRQIFGW